MSSLKATVMGGVDGIITSFAVMAASSLLKESERTALVVGISSLVADGFSMGVAEYISSAAQKRSEGPIHTTGPNSSFLLSSPILLGVFCFLSFVLCGSLPLLSYVIAPGENGQRLVVCSVSSLILLQILGTVQAVLTSEGHSVQDANKQLSIPLSSVQTTLLGAFAGGIAYALRGWRGRAHLVRIHASSFFKSSAPHSSGHLKNRNPVKPKQA